MLSGVFPKVFTALFRFPEKKRLWIYYLWAGFLFLAGIYIWRFIDHRVNWGQTPFDFKDWSGITVPRLTMLKDAIVKGVLPLHIFDMKPLNNMTDRFLAIPDVLFSPQVILLKWMQVNVFIVFETIFMYVIGFAGLLFLAVRKRLSSLAFTIFYALYCFNGYIAAHLGDGHLSWAGYFLLPWLLILVLDLIEKRQGWRWIAFTSIVLTSLFLQGGYHMYVYCLFLLLFLIPIAPRNFWAIVGAGISSVLLSAFRLAPSVVTESQISERLHYLGSNPFLAGIFQAMIWPSDPTQKFTYLGLTQPLGYWETDLFVGLIGTAFLICFGLIAVYRNRKRPGNYAHLLIPMAALTILSLNWFYKLIFNALPIPPINVERVPSRILGLVLILLITLAVIEFQRWADLLEPTAPVLLLSLGSLLALIEELEENLRIWSIESMSRLISERSSKDPLLWYASNHSDPVYFLSIKIGAAISFVTILILAFFSVWEWRKRKLASGGLRE